MRHFFRAAYRFGLPFAAAILLIFAIAGLVRVLLDQAGERNAYQQNAPTYAALGTPISATVTALAPVDTGLDRFGGVAVVMGAQVDVAQLFATNTPRGESPAMFATNTPDSAVEPVVTPAPTELPHRLAQRRRSRRCRRSCSRRTRRTSRTRRRRSRRRFR
ncbi:MAG: hypothetical protein HND48_10745 [Chloroflexi bacterium]|nr:hypothetical protein [Chloroflexota bacterium]